MSVNKRSLEVELNDELSVPSPVRLKHDLPVSVPCCVPVPVPQEPMSVDLVSDEDFPTPQFEAPEAFDFEGADGSYSEVEEEIIPVVKTKRLRGKTSPGGSPCVSSPAPDEEETPCDAPLTPDSSEQEEVPAKHKPATTAGGARQTKKKNKAKK